MRLLLIALIFSPIAAFAQTFDPTPRIAIMSAYEPEWTSLKAAINSAENSTDAGVEYVTGQLEGKEVVLFLSGISMVNAAMTTQMAIDRFNVTGIVFSGIAGGMDPELNLGDVVIADQWSQFLESVLARETQDGYELPPFFQKTLPNFGMMHPIPVQVARSGSREKEERFWFPADTKFLETAAATAETVELSACIAADKCVDPAPKIVIGGNGVSGSAFMDNAAFRKHVHAVFEARVVDMESAAVAHVAYVNEIPFIAFRSLSDLAGGSEDANELPVFLNLAAENSSRVVRAFVSQLE